MPKLPGKFDDIPKTASGVLGDDFQVSGYQFAAKQKTNLDGAVATTTVDMLSPKETIKTIGKLSWKFPKPFGVAGFALDKVEFDKSGKYKIEAAMTKDMHKVNGLSIACATDQDKAAQTKVTLTYTGIKDLQVKADCKPLDFKPDSVNCECLYGIGAIVVGMKLAGPKLDAAAAGVNYTNGAFFGSLLAKKTLTDFTAHGAYTVSKDLKVACTSNFQTSGKATLGLAMAFQGPHHGTLKVKAESPLDKISTPKVSAAIKKELVKGLTVIAGGSYAVSDGASTMGCKLSIE